MRNSIHKKTRITTSIKVKLNKTNVDSHNIVAMFRSYKDKEIYIYKLMVVMLKTVWLFEIDVIVLSFK